MAARSSTEPRPRLAPGVLAYVAWGPEAFLRNRAAERVFRAEVDPDTAEFSATLLWGDACSAEDVIGACQQLSMLGGRRIVFVRRAEKVTERGAGALVEYLGELAERGPDPDGALLILSLHCEVRQKKGPAWLGKVLEAGGRSGSVVGELHDRVWPNQLAEWAVKEAAAKGLGISVQTAAWLIQRAGAEIGVLAAEIGKAAVLLEPGARLEVADWEPLLGGGGGATLDEWLDEMGSGNGEAALRHLRCLLEEGAHPVFLHATAVRHVRMLLTLGAGGALRPPLPPFVIQRRKLADQAARMARMLGPRALDWTARADLQLKGEGRFEARQVLESLVASLAGMQAIPRLR